MNLRELAAADHRAIVGDVAGGFGRELTFTDPNNKTAVVIGFWNDIGQALDLQTGAMVAGTTAFVRVALGALRAVGLSVPEVVAGGEGRRPWVVQFQDMRGGDTRPLKFKIVDVRQDLSIDAVDCYLAEYRS